MLAVISRFILLISFRMNWNARFLFIRKWFIGKLFSVAQKVEKVRYLILETKESLKVYKCLKFDLYKVLCWRIH